MSLFHEQPGAILNCGDSLQWLPTLAADSIDSIICDPPYHLTARSRGSSPRQNDPETPFGRTKLGSKGFMGKAWDGGDVAFRPEIWAECLRVAKPGAFLLAFGGPRTFHRLAVAIEDAGWEIFDTIAWMFGSGFPKAKSSLKPAWEPIICARKPADRVRELNIDATRIGSGERPLRIHDGETVPCVALEAGSTSAFAAGTTSTGRWPANVILDSDAAAELDCQTGTLTSGKEPANGFKRNAPEPKARIYGGGDGLWTDEQAAGTLYGDSGGASRFFYCSKSPGSERNAGCDDLYWRRGDDGFARIDRAEWDATPELLRARGNIHATVKPLDLMQYLIKLVSHDGDTILDPFGGSFTTAVACVNEGRKFIGCDLDPNHCAIGVARLSAHQSLFSAK